MAINVLDSFIANRISAGEVVERPASIVKELVDNSIDANAKNITVEVVNGGIDYIKVTDDGCGIEESDIKKAFLPHATSKIKTLEDLDNIWTLGFRGEALASIASVSQVKMTSKTELEELSTVLEVSAGEYNEVRKSAGLTGTSIEVKNLFYNTPARRKFLRKPATETAEITNVMSRFILSKPNIKFKYFVDNQLVYSSNGTDLLSALSCVYNIETAQNILPVDIWDNNIHIYGYVSKLGFTKPNTTYQTLLVNGRYVIDETVSKAVYMAYEEFLMSRQFPFFILNIDMPFTDVDVNVHPNKLSIKFSKPSVIFDLIYNGVRKTIYNSTKPTESLETAVCNEELPTEEVVEIETDEESVVYDYIIPNNKQTLNQSVEAKNVSFFDKISTQNFSYLKPEKEETFNLDDVNFDSYKPITDFSNYKIVGEIFNEFIILEKDNNMLLLDFHAGHERLLYDQVIQDLKSKKLAVQDLLVPYIRELNATEYEFVLKFKQDLINLGFGLTEHSPTEIRLDYVPAIMKDINLKAFIDELLNDINNLKPKIGYELDSFLMKKACRSAVKAGQKLSELQIKHLLKDLDMSNPVLLCPHGRPIITLINKNEIEKWFKRIV